MVDTTRMGNPPRKTSLMQSSAQVARRKRKDYVLQGFGIAAILIAFTVLFILVASLVRTGYTAFVQTHITLDVYIDPAEISEEGLPRGGFRDVLTAALLDNLPEADPDADARAVRNVLSNGAQFELRDRVVADPSLIGQTITLTVPVSD